MGANCPARAKGYSLCGGRGDFMMLPRFALLCVGAAAMFAGSAAAETPTDHYSPETSPPIDNHTQTDSIAVPQRRERTG